jgi:hypothetical protein
LFQTSDPDEVVDHVPDACGGCGTDLAGASAAGMVCRQVHDIPTIRPVVVEHRLHRRRCRCGTTTTAAAPAGVAGIGVADRRRWDPMAPEDPTDGRGADAWPSVSSSP